MTFGASLQIHRFRNIKMKLKIKVDKQTQNKKWCLRVKLRSKVRWWVHLHHSGQCLALDVLILYFCAVSPSNEAVSGWFLY